MIASKKLKETLRLQGKLVFDWNDQTYIVSATFESFVNFCNSAFKSSSEMNDAFSSEDFREEARIDGYKWYEEESGDRHWVFYNTKMFEEGFSHLHFKKGCTEVSLPLNASSCYKMFERCELIPDVVFKDFNPVNVVTMNSMFSECGFYNGSNWNENLDTQNVKNMHGMFYGASFEEGLSLGDKFDTRMVTDMSSMFGRVEFPTNFTLGDKFDTHRVKKMNGMFKGCTMQKGFSLGTNFDTSEVEDMKSMFSVSVLSEDFSLGDNFNTEKVIDMGYMFRDCRLPNAFSLGDKFDTRNVRSMHTMFDSCVFPAGFYFGDKFCSDSLETATFMFVNATFNPEVKMSKTFNPAGCSCFGMFVHCEGLPAGLPDTDELAILAYLQGLDKEGIDVSK